MADPIKQQRWRQNTAQPSITAHLSRLETAVLDAIAMELWQKYPHDPKNGEENGHVFPGRPEAIRELCRRYAKSRPDKPWRRLSRARNAFALFYRAEASWRRTTTNSDAVAPKPPFVP